MVETIIICLVLVVSVLFYAHEWEIHKLKVRIEFLELMVGEPVDLSALPKNPFVKDA